MLTVVIILFFSDVLAAHSSGESTIPPFLVLSTSAQWGVPYMEIHSLNREEHTLGSLIPNTLLR